MNKFYKYILILLLFVLSAMFWYMLGMYGNDKEIELTKTLFRYQLYQEIKNGKKEFIVGNLRYTPLADGSWIVRIKERKAGK